MKIVAVGHRGTILDGPENSIHSHNRAYEMGARGIEFDIQSTKDNVFVVFHDSVLDHKSTGEGALKDKNYAELKNLYLWAGNKLSSERIPTLEDALRNVRGRFMVDLDFKGGPSNSANILRNILVKTNFTSDTAPLVTIFCRDEEDYNKLKSLDDICRLRPLYQSKEQISKMSNDGVKIMGIRNHHYKSKIVRYMKERNIEAFVNSMPRLNKKEARNHTPIIGPLVAIVTKWFDSKPEKIYKKASSAKAQFIQTDDLPGLVAYLKENGIYEDQALNKYMQPLEPVRVAPEILV